MFLEDQVSAINHALHMRFLMCLVLMFFGFGGLVFCLCGVFFFILGFTLTSLEVPKVH